MSKYFTSKYGMQEWNFIIENDEIIVPDRTCNRIWKFTKSSEFFINNILSNHATLDKYLLNSEWSEILDNNQIEGDRIYLAGIIEHSNCKFKELPNWFKELFLLYSLQR